MLVGKPLATRTEPATAKPQRTMKGAPLNTGFNRLMQQGGNDALTPKDMTAGGAVSAMQAKAMGTLTQLSGGPETPVSLAAKGTAAQANQAPRANSLLNSNPLNTAIRRPKRKDAETAETAVRVSANRGKRPGAGARIEKLVRMEGAGSELTGVAASGSLSAKFESGKEGVAAIGYDRHGGTSYGKYQLSSRAGSMKRFIEFLKTEEPDFATRLEKSGPANTGGKRGRMPDTWKKLAAEAPARFEDLQNRFIHQSHFLPAVKAVSERTGLAVEGMPDTFKEVVFSTAVQHGASGAARIVSRALNSVDQSKLNPETSSPEAITKAGEDFIRRIYAIRHKQFGSSTSQVQAAVKNRLNQEMNMAIAMLRQEKIT